MLEVRRSAERAFFDHGWLKTFHTFSFADYYDSEWSGYGPLRVINEDRVAPGNGFGKHGHRDMEILTYILEGKLAHKDSIGHEQLLGPNEIQRMSAGTGVMHSEYNGSKTDPVHFFQIWIEPATHGTRPSYEQIKFDPAEKQNQWKRLASPAHSNGSAQINQDAHVFVADLSKGARLPYDLAANRAAWVHAVRGEVTVNGVALKAGDAAAVTGENLAVAAAGPESTELLLFDLGA